MTTQPIFDDESYDEDDYETEENEAIAGVSAWGISIVVHAVVIALMTFVVFFASIKDDQAPLQITQIDPPKEEKEEEKERDVVEVETDIESEVIVEDAVITELDLPVEELETEDEEIAEVPVKGREEADAASEMGGPGAFMAIGAGGGASGAFGNRNGGGRKNAVGRYGGSKASESAVEASLRWFMRHQSPNGQWDVDGYPMNCQEPGPKCEPGEIYKDAHGCDVACTGYALLCFLGAGYDHRTPNRYQQVVQKGLDWLLSVQKADGLLGQRNYEHPVATMALAEAYAMTNDPALRDATQMAVDVILARQGERDGYPFAWDYIHNNGAVRNDSSVTGWMVMALKSAKAGGIDIGAGLDGAERWLEAAWTAGCQASGRDANNLDPYGTSIFPYTHNAADDSVNFSWQGKKDNLNEQYRGRLTCVGLVCSVFLGKKAGDKMLDTMANWVFEHQTPSAWPTDSYFMYYNTLGMFQVGGDQWQTWNETVRDMLVHAQRKDPACFNGSWDPQGAGGTHVADVGRLLVTAYCTLSLEVYYRYMPVAGAKK